MNATDGFVVPAVRELQHLRAEGAPTCRQRNAEPPGEHDDGSCTSSRRHRHLLASHIRPRAVEHGSRRPASSSASPSSGVQPSQRDTGAHSGRTCRLRDADPATVSVLSVLSNVRSRIFSHAALERGRSAGPLAERSNLRISWQPSPRHAQNTHLGCVSTCAVPALNILFLDAGSRIHGFDHHRGNRGGLWVPGGRRGYHRHNLDHAAHAGGPRREGSKAPRPRGAVRRVHYGGFAPDHRRGRPFVGELSTRS